MALTFQKAIKRQLKLRMTLDGPTGCGKTYTALLFATEIIKRQGGRIAVIDTENRSASKYADLFDFDVLELSDFDPRHYIQGMGEAAEAGYTVLIIDSLTHAWSGTGGILDMHDNATRKQRTENSYTAWREVTPLHNELVEALVRCPIHLITTMRSKMEYVLNEIEDNGRKRTQVERVGMKPVQREGIEYEFDVICDMDIDHRLIVTKSRCHVVADKQVLRPGGEFIHPVLDWLESGEEAHWATIPANQQAIKTAMTEAGIDFREALKALGDIARFSDYLGTLDEAKQAISRYVDAKAEAEAKAEQETVGL